MLELKRLRQETYAAWQWLQSIQTGNPKVSQLSSLNREDAHPLHAHTHFADTHFKDAIREQYGDLRYRATWEKAAIDLTAHRISQCYLEPHQIVGYLTSSDYLHCAIRKYYGERLIEAVLQFPEILEMLQDGLEHLYHVSNNTADRELALMFTHKIARRLFPRSQVTRAA